MPTRVQVIAPDSRDEREALKQRDEYVALHKPIRVANYETWTSKDERLPPAWEWRPIGPQDPKVVPQCIRKLLTRMTWLPESSQPTNPGKRPKLPPPAPTREDAMASDNVGWQGWHMDNIGLALSRSIDFTMHRGPREEPVYNLRWRQLQATCSYDDYRYSQRYCQRARILMARGEVYIVNFRYNTNTGNAWVNEGYIYIYM